MCGCNDSPLPLYNDNPCINEQPVILPVCTNGEKCEDVIKDICVEYTGPNLPCLGVTTTVNNVFTPVRLDVIIAAVERAICELQTSASYVTANCTVTTNVFTDIPGDNYQLFFDWVFVSGATYDITIYDDANNVVVSVGGLSIQSNPAYTDSSSTHHSFATDDTSDLIYDNSTYTYEITKHDSCGGSTTCARQSFTTNF